MAKSASDSVRVQCEHDSYREKTQATTEVTTPAQAKGRKLDGQNCY